MRLTVWNLNEPSSAPQALICGSLAISCESLFMGMVEISLSNFVLVPSAKTRCLFDGSETTTETTFLSKWNFSRGSALKTRSHATPVPRVGYLKLALGPQCTSSV
eukprot:Amastigsp_a676496_131.p7 type:complete len:105 gc:universal Amastigsp_a676496_131:1154-840(-)